MMGAERGGDLAAMEALVDRCMNEYDEHGWRQMPFIETPAKMMASA